ncbi:MAG: radical SAM protein [Candidatus Cloacimonetes bacterium]|nr:radical SAM protein [Candidatus Cloacimonadota bacterium]MBS3768190.1 radical SAM protein [Candidatus Cloacimonadota bacterium]
MISNNKLKQIHIIEKRRNNVIVYCNWIQELLEMSPKTYEILDLYINKNFKEKEILNTYSNLKDRQLGQLIEKFNHVVLKITKKIYNKKISNKFRNAEIKINLTHKCNLDCSYCYVKKRYPSMGNMTKNTGKNIIDFFNKQFDGYNIKITFFGGEPLLNFSTMEYICEYATNKKKNNFQFGMISNGTILNKKIIYLIKTYKMRLTISFDGPKYVHNRLRCYQNGKGTYDDIKSNIKTLQKNKIPIDYETTYTSIHEAYNLTRHELIEFQKRELGFEDGVISNVSTFDVDTKKLKNKNNKSKDSLDYIEKGELVEPWMYFPFHAFFNKIFIRYLCGVGKIYFDLTPDGSIYPCQLLVGLNNNELKMGNVNSDVNKNFLELQKKIDIFDHFKNKKCKSCWAKFLCKGCPAQMYSENEKLTISEKFCKTMKKNIELLLKKFYHIRKNEKKYKLLIDRCKEKYKLNY